MDKNPFIIPEIGQIEKKGSKGENHEWEQTLVDSGPFRPRTVKPLFDYNKFKWVYFVIFIIFAIVWGRVFYLQIMSGDNLRSAAEENRYRIYNLSAPRGIVYDRNNNLLVKNIPAFDLVVIPADLPKDYEEKNNILNKVGKIISLEDEEKSIFLNETNDASYEPILIKKNIARKEALSMEAELDKFTGIKIEKNPIRDYIYAEEFAHVLGYIGNISEEELKEFYKRDDDYQLIDYVGKEGIEKKYESNLRGTKGKIQVEVDSLGNVRKTVAKEEAIEGQDLVLTIDKDLQLESRKILKNSIDKAKAKKGVCIAINPKNGEILSLVNIPSYNNNLFSKGIKPEEYSGLIKDEDKPLYNRAASGIYPPGSTIKPVMAAAGLQEGIVDVNTTINDKGSIDVVNKYNADIVYHFVGWERAGLGLMNLYSAMARSSDIYFYYVGGGYEDFDGLGAEKIIQYYRKFGMGLKTGIDLPTEADGLIPTPAWKEKVKEEQWYLGDTYHISIGQGDLLTTPLQVLSWTATVANGGQVLRPYLVKEGVNREKNIIFKNEKNIVREGFISDEYMSQVKRAMRETVLSGSGKLLSDLPVSSAGKTGTAQHGGSDKTHAWFIAFAPYEDPEIALVVLVEEGGEGHDAAVPVANEILKWYFENKEQ